jgi:hypothetical protein
MKTLLKTAAVAVLLIGCGTDSSSENEDQLPTTYTFENVSYSGQITRIEMLDELVSLGKSGNASGTEVSATALKNKFANAETPFENAELNESTKQLASKTFELDLPLFEGWMDSLALISQSTEAGEAGVAGVVTSSNGEKNYLQDANGREYIQLIAKGLMGATLYYQAVSNYLNPDDGIAKTVDNVEVTEGKGTDLAHHWDEAYGYFAGSTEFPAEEGKYWGAYAQELDEQLGSVSTILNAFIKGRAAIDKDNRETMLAAAEEVKAEWDRLIAGCAVHYINKGLANIGDDALRNHALSEGYAFALSIKYNADMKISSANLDKVLANFGDDFYNVNPTKLNEAKDLLVEAYSFEEIADTL